MLSLRHIAPSFFIKTKEDVTNEKRLRLEFEPILKRFIDNVGDIKRKKGN